MGAKKTLLIAVVLIVCLGVGSAAVATAKLKKKNIQTKLGITVTGTDPGTYQEASTTAYGNVRAKGPKGCTKGRLVGIFHNGVLAAAVKTGRGGAYSATIPGLSSGNWQAGVTERRIKKKKKHKKYICRLGATSVVVVP